MARRRPNDSRAAAAPAPPRRPGASAARPRPAAQVVGQGKAILGYTVVGHVALLLLAEKVRVSATLPGHHEVRTATTTRWHRITLQVGSRGGRRPPAGRPRPAGRRRRRRRQHAAWPARALTPSRAARRAPGPHSSLTRTPRARAASRRRWSAASKRS
jgi:hypothetical protein